MASGDITTTLVGNLGGDPELRFTPSGAAVCNISIACTPRRFDKNKQEYVDQDTTWVRLNVWREMAEYCAETLTKGMRVIVTGTLQNRKWETPEGDERWSLEMNVDEIGPALRYATAKVTKTTTGGGRQNPPPPEEPGSRAAQPAAASAGRNTDPWAGGGTPDEHPPF